METIVAATKNEHKIKEIEAITKLFGMKVISRDDAGVPDVEIEETGETFEENSLLKAEGIMKLCGKPTIADDSGLEVDCLGKAPGVYSSPEERTARFVSVITMVFPSGEKLVARGTVEGHVIPELRGEAGFGYDPLFIPEGHTRTFGEFEADEKNSISHRGNALRKLRELLDERKKSV